MQFPYSGPKALSDGEFQSCFNGFQVCRICPSSSQCEKLLGPSPCSGLGYSQRDYTIKTTLKDFKDYPLLKSLPVLEVFDFFTLDLFAAVLLIFPDACK